MADDKKCTFCGAPASPTPDPSTTAAGSKNPYQNFADINAGKKPKPPEPKYND